MRKASIPIGFNIFFATMAIVSGVLLMASFASLAVFSKALDEQVAAQSREINKQIVRNFESYINSVIETANYIQFASYTLDAARDAGAMSELYAMNVELKRDMAAVFLFDLEGNVIAGPTVEYSRSLGVRAMPWFEAALKIPEIFHFSAGVGKSLSETKDEEIIAVAKAIEYTRNENVFEGVLLIELKRSAIVDLARASNLGAAGHILILDENGVLLYTSESAPGAMTLLSYPIAAQMFMGGRTASLGRSEAYLNVNTLGQTRWRIVTVNDVDQRRAAVQRFGAFLLIMLVVSVAVSGFVAGLISMQVSRPIGQLKRAMQKVELGDLSAPLEVHGQQEIVALSHSFNSMVTKIGDLMSNLVAQQREKRKSELLALQNQINPHFLYNTLDSIVWLAEHGRNSDVVTTVVSLARFFRISISKGETFITVEDEIAHVHNYLTIQSIRYVDKFTYKIDVEPSILQLKVMKLILQPIVENAIYHGVGEESGHILISGRLDGDFLEFEVINSGYGISPSRVQEMYDIMRGGSAKPSVGIRNVYQRLTLYYGPRAEVIITSVPDESTSVALRIPHNPLEQEQNHET